MHDQLMDFVLPTVAVLVLLFWMRGRWSGSGSHPEEDTPTGNSATTAESCPEENEAYESSDNSSDKKKTKKKPIKFVKKKKKTSNPSDDGDADRWDDWAPMRIGRSKLHPIASFRDRTGHQDLRETVAVQKRLSVSVGPIMLSQCLHQSIDSPSADPNEAPSTLIDFEVSSTVDSPPKDSPSPIYVCV